MQRVEIRIEGHLNKGWVDWLGGFTITHTEDDQTLLTGTVQDQAALYGLMAKLRDLGVKLESVNYGRQPSGENSW
jgi:hypothetical protein